MWGSRLADLQHPDWCILDLDPKGAPFDHVVTLARAIHGLCDELGLPSFPKTSGASGLHVLLPLGGQCTFEQSRSLAHLIAWTLVREHPRIPDRDWQWNHAGADYDGVHTRERCLTWYSEAGPGGGATQQSFEDFLVADPRWRRRETCGRSCMRC